MKIKNNISISNSGFVFNPSNGETFSVNPIGNEIINLMKEGKFQEDIRSIILDKYYTEKNSFENDYYDFINMLNIFDLVEEYE
ncbi:MAG: PqqD family protein [Bacteroidota bacterium]|nr:PqqD family protein [Bacteroidota bacterium]